MADLELAGLSRKPRAPLPGIRKVPIAEASSEEQAMFDSLVGNSRRASDLSKFSTLIGKNTPPAKQAGPSDADMVAAMAARLRSLERQLALANEEVSAKSSSINKLRQKIKVLELQKSSSEASHSNAWSEMQREYAKLQHQVHAMETFLADYGMVWVGNEDESTDDGEGDEQDEQDDEEEEEELSQIAQEVREPVVTTTEIATQMDNGASLTPKVASEPTVGANRTRFEPLKAFSVNYDKVIANIKELNVLAGEGAAKVVKHGQGARLEHTQNIPLVLYKNGMFLFAGPFRPFTDGTAQMFMRDLMDGYFPWELKTRYPEGVPISVTDQRTVDYVRSAVRAFPGPGVQLGGQSAASRLLTADNTQQSSSSSFSAQQGHKTVDRLQQQLPASVIRNGCIVDVRRGVMEQLSTHKGKHTVSLVKTPVAEFLAARASGDDTQQEQEKSSERPQTPLDICTLQIKTEDGQETLILKMRFTDSFADVKQCIQQHRRASFNSRVFTTFPRQEIKDDDDSSLIDLGLVPNATLRLAAAKRN